MVEILRVSLSGDSVIYKENGRYYSLDTETNLKSGGMDSLRSFTSSGGWRRATKSDKSKYLKFVDSGITVVHETPARKYRLPNSIKNTISELDYSTLSSILTVDEINFLIKSSNRSDGMTQDDIAELNSISKKVSDRTSILTASGQSWINKIEQGLPPLVAAGVSFDGEDDEYYATSPDSVYPTSVNALYKVDGTTVYRWVEGDFRVEEGMTPDNFTAPSIVPIDNITAQVFASWLDSNSDADDGSDMLFNLEESDPAENNLMKAGEAELEEEFASMAEIIMAAGNRGYFAPTKRTNGTKTLGKNWAKMMIKSYTPAERSANASKQKRNSSGQFAKGGGSGKSSLGATTRKLPKPKRSKGKKARLGASNVPGSKYKTGTNYRPEAIPTIQKSLEDWARESIEKQFNEGVAKEGKKGEYKLASRVNTSPNAPTGPDGSVVADEDADAKQKAEYEKKLEETRKKMEDLVLTAYNRRKNDDDSALTSSGENKESDTRYVALVAADDHDAVTDIVAVRRANGELSTWVRSKGEWEEDAAVKEDILGMTPPPMVELEDEEQIKNVIAQVDEFDGDSSFEEEEPVAASIYSEFGEVYPVSAAAEGIKGTQRLKAYWTRGKGAAKIRWGTKGDLTRCHRHLSKYLGSQRAWGYCQNRHQDIFGVSNAKRDKG